MIHTGPVVLLPMAALLVGLVAAVSGQPGMGAASRPEGDDQGGIDRDSAERSLDKPVPDVRDFRYGPHFGNSFDLYLARSDTPTPLLIWTHGGAFLHGDKAGVPLSLLQAALDEGISVASVNYRLSQQEPFPASFHDVGRAIQYLRFDASRWNLNRKQFICAGSSAGGGISLWLAFHDDLADPTSADMVAAQSSRPNLLTCIDTQCSYDPHFIRKIIPGAAADNRAMKMLFRVRAGDFDTDWARQRFAEGSAINFVSAGAPPVLLFYRYPNTQPTDTLPGSHGIHHPLFGHVLKAKLDSLGVECVVSGAETHPEMKDADLRRAFAAEAIAFIRKHFPRQP